jgi:DNA segregation ATPase FtsK/SpoIIIE, S-DNA-T family
MRLVLELHRSGRDDVDLAVDLDAAATVRDLAGALDERDPSGPRPLVGTRTLQVLGSPPRTLDPYSPVLESGLMSGEAVTVVSAGDRFADRPGETAVRVHVLEGPDAPRTIELAVGTAMIGRAADCEVRLSDSSVSRVHAKLHVGDTVEIVDAGSANGIQVGRTTVPRALLGEADRVCVGDTVLAVEPVGLTSSARTAGTHVQFNRSPRVDPEYAGPAFVLPEPPQRPQPVHLPMISLLTPLLFGAVLFAITRSAASIVFVALSPVMALGSVIEQRFSGGRSYKAALAAFRQQLVALGERGRAAAVDEVAHRGREHPATSDVVSAVASRSSLLWTRSPGGPRFLQLRLGLGPGASRATLELPTARQGDPAVWDEIERLAADLAHVDGVPVVADLTSGTVGVAGSGTAAVDALRALVVQLVGLHSPAEVVLAAFLDASASADDWSWLLWLPHTSSPHSPLSRRHVVSTAAGIGPLVTELENLVQERSQDQGWSGPQVVALVQDGAPVDRARLVGLARSGRDVGVHVIWSAPQVAMLPAECVTYLNVLPGDTGAVVGRVAEGQEVGPVLPERVSAPAATGLARGLTPLVDAGAAVDDGSDLPRTASWVTLHPGLLDRPEQVVERWQESRSIIAGPYARRPSAQVKGSLRAVVGTLGTEPHVLDLRLHGPHALVGGTTGSGKSELLQSWILGMAAAHSPQRVTFLLVDYKGGSAFKDCLELPHTVGLVTDLSPHLVRRALTSLSAELRYREHMLARHQAKDLEQLESMGVSEAPPSLVIVVDEFAALVKEVPEFVDGVVNVAQRGRSLGLHLILATQRPAGVIKDNLRANTNLRLALRMADAEDSQDVLGSPVAGGFDPALPGRAVSKTGPGRLVAFQSAYAGGRTSSTPPPPQMTIDVLTTGEAQRWEPPEVDVQVVAEPGPTDISRAVETIRRSADLAEMDIPRKPWLPELASTFDLRKLPRTRRDTELVFGVRDDPERQAQEAVAFRPDVDGNLIVYGTGGSGKSTLLRTLAATAGWTSRGGPCHVYGIDFGSRGLDILQGLPHVGAVVQGTDDERVQRLVGWLRAEVDERAERFGAVRAATITEYRALPGGRADEPRLLLVVDGVPAFRAAYEGVLRERWFNDFVDVASRGRGVGVHVVMSADRPSSVPGSLIATVQRRIVLRLADADEYSTHGEPSDVLSRTSPPGRAVEQGAEIQVATPAGSSSVLEQTVELARWAEGLRQGGMPDAPGIDVLAETVALDALPATVAGRPTIGVASTTLSPVGLPDSATFVVCGPPGSGRSSVLRSILESLRRTQPATSLHWFGPARSSLRDLPWWATRAATTQDHEAVAASLQPVLTDAPAGTHVVVLEGVPDLAGGIADMAVTQLVKTAIAAGHLVIGEGDSSQMGSSFGLVGLVTSARAGIALQPEQGDGNVFRVDFPRVRRADFPPGRGLLVHRGRSEVTQMALPPGDGTSEGTPPHSLVLQ